MNDAPHPQSSIGNPSSPGSAKSVMLGAVRTLVEGPTLRSLPTVSRWARQDRHAAPISKAPDLLTRPARGTDRPLLDYALAFVVGVIALIALFPVPGVLGTGAIWAAPFGDVAQSLTGHLAYQQDPWRWPLLTTGMMMWPHGASIAMSDSNPFFSLIAKAATRTLGLAPINLLGAWLALCIMLQPVAAVFALRGITRGRPEAALAIAALSMLSLAWLARLGHINLMGHFVILAALGLALRMLQDGVRRGWAKSASLLTAAMLFHPNLFLMCVAVLAAVPAEASLLRRASINRHWTGFLLSCVIPFALFRLLSGEFGNAASGFGYYSMNLLSPVWPQVSGLFGPGLPTLDATGGQYEGFNYLGAGVLFLIVAAGVSLAATRRLPRLHPGLLLALAGLTAVALSTRVFAAHTLLLDLGGKHWEFLFAPMRASGRFFWPVGYALLVGAVVATGRLPRKAAAAVLAAAVLLQAADARPLLQQIGNQLAGRASVKAMTVQVPPGTTLVVPVPPIMCSLDQETYEISEALLLRTARAGMRLGDAALARQPSWFSCDKAWLDAMEAPLVTGEARVFTQAASAAELRLARFGTGARCGQVDAITVCGRGPVPPAGTPITTMGQVAHLAAVTSGLAGAALLPVLANGWTLDADGVPVSSGRLATLLFTVDGLPPGHGIRATLHFGPISSSGTPRARKALLRANMRYAARMKGHEDEPDTVSVEFTPEEAAAGVFRIAFDLTPDADTLEGAQPVPVRLTSFDISPAASGSP